MRTLIILLISATLLASCAPTCPGGACNNSYKLRIKGGKTKPKAYQLANQRAYTKANHRANR